MPNQRRNNANIVPKGTTPDDFSPQISAFRKMKKTEKDNTRKHEGSF
jgi:hypothetical protein